MYKWSEKAVYNQKKGVGGGVGLHKKKDDDRETKYKKSKKKKKIVNRLRERK